VDLASAIHEAQTEIFHTSDEATYVPYSILENKFVKPMMSAISTLRIHIHNAHIVFKRYAILKYWG